MNNLVKIFCTKKVFCIFLFSVVVQFLDRLVTKHTAGNMHSYINSTGWEYNIRKKIQITGTITMWSKRKTKMLPVTAACCHK